MSSVAHRFIQVDHDLSCEDVSGTRLMYIMILCIAHHASKEMGGTKRLEMERAFVLLVVTFLSSLI